MIKLNRNECPKELTEELKKELTKNFIDTGKSVWKQPFIEKSLLESSNEKCAYCECKINQESKYMEVEHYHDKNTYPEDVINWDNLLPSCKRCNGHKSRFDTKINPFINPYDMHPKEHLVLGNYRFYPLTHAGRNTIGELLLNDSKKLVKQRFEVAEAVVTQLEEIYERTSDYKNCLRRTPQNKKKIVSNLTNLMNEGIPTSAYCATVATAMINDIHFLFIVEVLKEEQLWTCEMQQLYGLILESSLNTDLTLSKRYYQQSTEI